MLMVPRLVSGQQRLGHEFQVNVHTESPQAQYAIAADDEGDFIVVWQSAHDGPGFDIFARGFGNGGTPQTPEFRVNTYTFDGQSEASVAVDGEGAAIVTWTSPRDGNLEGVFAQRFDAFGDALGTEFQVNVHTVGSQNASDVARASGGKFVVVWHSQQDGDGTGIFARVFENFGSPITTEFMVNTYTSGSQYFPAIAVSQDGSFVIVWESVNQDGSFRGVFGRRLDALGLNFIGAEFQVNTYTSLDQRRAEVALDATGGFVVVWDSYQDGDLLGVFAQRFASDTSRIGVEFQVNSTTTMGQQL